MPVPSDHGGLAGVHGDAGEPAIGVAHRLGDRLTGTGDALQAAHQEPGLGVRGGEEGLSVESRSGRSDAGPQPPLGDSQRQVDHRYQLEREPDGDYEPAPAAAGPQQEDGESDCEKNPHPVVHLEQGVHAIDEGEALCRSHGHSSHRRQRPRET